MAFIDIEDAIPSNEGIYRVKITGNKGVREEQAYWTKGTFSLVSGTLNPEEYIYAWWHY